MLIAMKQPILAAPSPPRNSSLEIPLTTLESPFDFRPRFCFTKHGNYLRLFIDHPILSFAIVFPSGVCPQVLSVLKFTA